MPRESTIDHNVMQWHVFIIITIFLMTSGMSNPASATIVTYKGYEEYGGSFHDAEKSPSNNQDDLMCWAAAASNVLAWTGWGNVPGESFNNEDDIFGYFIDHWTDDGGSMVYGWDWWFDGTNDSPTGEGWSEVDVAGGGFWEPPYTFTDYFLYTTNTSAAMSAVDVLLHDGYGVTLGVLDGGGGGHAITIWGYNYDNVSGDYLGIWITDSDDKKYLEDPPDDLAYYDVQYNSGSGRWYLNSFYGSNDWYINEVQGLAASPVPEPGTMLLMGIGISGLYGLRRRHFKKI